MSLAKTLRFLRAFTTTNTAGTTTHTTCAGGGGTTKKDEAHSWANAVKRIGPYAWKLLVLIVKKHGDNREHGTEVLVQGFTELGSTPQKYRTALKQLKRMGLISFVGVRAGTLARINGPDVFFMVETEENWEGYGRLTVL